MGSDVKLLKGKPPENFHKIMYRAKGNEQQAESNKQKAKNNEQRAKINEHRPKRNKQLAESS